MRVDFLIFFLSVLLVSACGEGEFSTNEPISQTTIDSIALVKEKDSVDRVLSDLRTTESQAAELSITMSSLIKKASTTEGDSLEVINLDEQYYSKIDSVPEDRFGGKELYVGGELDSTQFVYILDNNRLKPLFRLPEGFPYNPYKKTANYFQNNKLVICSEQAFRAAQVCGILIIQGNSLNVEGITQQDPSEDAIELAYKALKENHIPEAVGYFEQVQYPQYYLQIEEEVIHLIDIAYPIAKNLIQKQQYDSAEQVLGSVFNFWGSSFLLDIDNQNHLQQLLNDFDSQLTINDYLQMWNFYTHLLLENKKYLRALEASQYTTQLFPSSSTAYLYLGDACYHLEKLEESRQAYRRFQSLANRDATLIPKRAIERLGK